GLLDDTLVLWGGEFGRTVYSQGGLSKENYGRDHHPRCFTVWMAGGGAKAGIVHGQTDDFCYNVVKDPVHVRDFNATVLRLLGIDHQRLTFKFQGLEQKLTGVVPGKIGPALMASNLPRDALFLRAVPHWLLRPQFLLSTCKHRTSPGIVCRCLVRAFTLTNACMIGLRHRMGWCGETPTDLLRTNKDGSMWPTRSTSRACAAS